MEGHRAEPPDSCRGLPNGLKLGAHHASRGRHVVDGDGARRVVRALYRLARKTQ